MHRRHFMQSLAAAGAAAAIGRQAHAATTGWRRFEITYHIRISDAGAPVRLWVPVPQDALDYQRVIDLSWRSPVAPPRCCGRRLLERQSSLRLG